MFGVIEAVAEEHPASGNSTVRSGALQMTVFAKHHVLRDTGVDRIEVGLSRHDFGWQFEKTVPLL